MNTLMKILHIIPFVHFYEKWSDTVGRDYGGCERQQRFCIVCNKKQYRTVQNSDIMWL